MEDDPAKIIVMLAALIKLNVTILIFCVVPWHTDKVTHITHAGTYSLHAYCSTHGASQSEGNLYVYELC